MALTWRSSRPTLASWSSTRRPAPATGGPTRRLVALAFLLVLLLAGCSDDDSVGPVIPTLVDAGFTPSGSAATADLVRLRQGSATGNTVVLEVALSGVTTSSDLYSFAFDLLLGDPTVAQYVAGSAAVGTALTTGAGQSLSTQATQQGDRVVVAVTKVGGGAGSGNGLGAAEEVVVSLSFLLNKVGTSTISFVGSPTNPIDPTNDPAVLDSAGGVIGSISFDTPATLTGS